MSYNTYCRRRIAACEHLHAAAFKSLAASCYSGVPCFHPEPGPTVRTQRDTGF